MTSFFPHTHSSVWQVHSLSLCSSIFQAFEFNVAVSTKALSGSLISLNSGWLNINLLAHPISKSLVPGSILRGCAGQHSLPEGFHHMHSTSDSASQGTAQEEVGVSAPPVPVSGAVPVSCWGRHSAGSRESRTDEFIETCSSVRAS